MSCGGGIFDEKHGSFPMVWGRLWAPFWAPLGHKEFEFKGKIGWGSEKAAEAHFWTKFPPPGKKLCVFGSGQHAPSIVNIGTKRCLHFLCAECSKADFGLGLGIILGGFWEPFRRQWAESGVAGWSQEAVKK